MDPCARAQRGDRVDAGDFLLEQLEKFRRPWAGSGCFELFGDLRPRLKLGRSCRGRRTARPGSSLGGVGGSSTQRLTVGAPGVQRAGGGPGRSQPASVSSLRKTDAVRVARGSGGGVRGTRLVGGPCTRPVHAPPQDLRSGKRASVTAEGVCYCGESAPSTDGHRTVSVSPFPRLWQLFLRARVRHTPRPALSPPCPRTPQGRSECARPGLVSVLIPEAQSVESGTGSSSLRRGCGGSGRCTRGAGLAGVSLGPTLPFRRLGSTSDASGRVTTTRFRNLRWRELFDRTLKMSFVPDGGGL